MKKLIGTSPDQIPTNNMLGTMAYQSANNYQALSAILNVTTASATITPLQRNIVCNYAGTITLTLPAAYLMFGAEICIKTLTASQVNNDMSNIFPLASDIPGSGILSPFVGKWVRLVSAGGYWVVMSGN